MKLIRTLIQKTVETAVKLFDGKGRPGETFTNRALMQHYGFTSRPRAGAEGLALLTGNMVVMIATEDRRYRLAVADGEVALYTDEGDHIHFKRDNNMVIQTKTLEIKADESCSIVTRNLDITASEGSTLTTGTLDITASTAGTLTTQTLTLAAAAGTVLNSPQVTASGAMAAGGDISDQNGSMQTMRDVYNSHDHVETDSTTQAPGDQM